jgi:hypothetical protein
MFDYLQVPECTAKAAACEDATRIEKKAKLKMSLPLNLTSWKVYRVVGIKLHSF